MLRLVLVANTLGVGLYTADEMVRPALGGVVVAGVVAWSLLVTWAYADASRRTWRLLAVDLAVALVALVLTPVAKPEGFDATLAGFWVMSPMLAWAARAGWRGGLVAGLLVGGTDLLIRDDVTQGTYGNIFLLVVGGPVVGYLVESLQRAAVERDRAEREAAAAAERARLARAQAALGDFESARKTAADYRTYVEGKELGQRDTGKQTVRDAALAAIALPR